LAGGAAFRVILKAVPPADGFGCPPRQAATEASSVSRPIGGTSSSSATGRGRRRPGFATLDADAPLEPRYKAIVLPIASLADYVGKYRFNSGALVDFTAQGRSSRSTDHRAALLPNLREYQVDAQLKFEHDASGKVVAVVLHQNGRDIRGDPRDDPTMTLFQKYAQRPAIEGR
jgi:hypothetical protein